MKPVSESVDPASVPMFANLSDEERADAVERVRQYLELVSRIHERIKRDPVAYAEFIALTKADPRGRVEEIDRADRS